VNEPKANLDTSIEDVVEWRASRAVPSGLLELDREPQRSRYPWSGRAVAMGRLAWLGVLLALLVAAAVGVSMSGGGRQLPAVAPLVATPSPQAATAQSAGFLYCDQTRALPFVASAIDLTGTWTDQSETFFLRQQGSVVWGVGIGAFPGMENSLPLSGHPYLALRGTVGPGSVVHLDFGEAGAITPTDSAFTPPLGNGSIDLRAQAGPDGNLELATVSQSGEIIEGPGFNRKPVFSPCVTSSAP
jgi:hypothetical protein